MKTSRGINEQKVVEVVIDFWKNHEIQNEEGTKEQGVTVILCLKGRGGRAARRLIFRTKHHFSGAVYCTVSENKVKNICI